jgi:hypothetical protein
MSDYVYAIAVSGPDLYAGGAFTEAGGISGTEHIARWDGSAWYPLGSGLNGSVLAIKVEGPDVYVGGAFTNAGGILPADYLARWDGSSWHAVGTSFGTPSLAGWVRAIETVGKWVAVGGDFTNGGYLADGDHIVVWNGSSWSALSPGLNHWVRTIESVGPDLYAGGDFDDAGGTEEGDLVARWGTVYTYVYLPLTLRLY